MADGNHVDVVLVADDGDPHQLAVEAQLHSLGAQPLRLNLADLTSTRLISHTGALDVKTGDSWSRVDRKTTVWWFRAGRARPVEGTEIDEAQLIVDEAPSVLVGSLRAAGVHWVDDPDVTRCAEWKLGQLALASNLKIPTPRGRRLTTQPRRSGSQTRGSSWPVSIVRTRNRPFRRAGLS
jgi:hypothetical protein